MALPTSCFKKNNFIFLVVLLISPILFSTEKKINFEKQTLKLSGQILTIEIADDDSKRQQGLMFREKLPEGTGMLFIFEDEAPRSFWMKNTFIDLDIGFFDENEKLIDMQTMTAAKSVMDERPPPYPSNGPAKYALELPKGWFQKHKTKLGEHFVVEESKLKSKKRPGSSR